MAVQQATGSRGIRSLVPARIDRLSWSRFHTRMVIALGVAWILDGLEVSIASTVTPYMTEPSSLNMSPASVAFSVGTIYLLGEVFGALLFGNLSDRWGRRNLFMITLGVYLIGGGLSALTFGVARGGCSTSTSPGSSRARASAASTRPSTRPSMSSSRRACAVTWI